MNSVPASTLEVVLRIIGWLLWLAINGGFVALSHYLLALPMRRTERGLLFLDLVETAVRQGQRIEEAVVSISQSRDETLGARFHLLAAWLEKGLRLHDALAKVPRLLPPPIPAMLHVGHQLGDMRQVLPACRQLLKDAISQTRGAINYLVVLVLLMLPMSIYLLMVLAVIVFPRFQQVLVGMEAQSQLFDLVMGYVGWIVVAQVGLLILLLTAAFIYIGGPRLVRWLNFHGYPLADWIAWRVPWKRKRMQRTFSAMLSLLLDGGVPEAEAVRLAADCTANEIFHQRAAQVIAALQRGVKLTEAVQMLDDTGEFRWRLTNAAHAQGGFLRALAGWHESLDARAFQQEQAAAHVVSSALVVANGALVALVVIAVFSVLISIINLGCQW